MPLSQNNGIAYTVTGVIVQVIDTTWYIRTTLSSNLYAKVVPYSITSIGDGGGPGFLAVSPHMI